MFIFLLTGMLTLAFDIQPAKAEAGTIYIRADGSIDPPTTPISTLDNVTYVFTDDINGSIVVERDGIVIDGSGRTLLGMNTYDSKGIELSGTTNVTIQNLQIKAFYYGIWLNGSSDDSISRNNLTGNGYGIELFDCNNVTVEFVDLSCNAVGIEFCGTCNSTITNNLITGHRWSVEFLNSSKNVVCGNIIANDTDGVQLWSSSGNSICGNSMAANYNDGVSLHSSSNNTIFSNVIAVNYLFGVYVGAISNGNTIYGNNITKSVYGVMVSGSSNNNTISGNDMTDNLYGLFLYSSSENMIGENVLEANSFDGVFLESSSNNTVIGNDMVANNHDGVELKNSSNNVFYHNNFIASTAHADDDSMFNAWDNGYPAGGNYWSDYNGSDNKSGPCQDQPASDGIGDVPYIIDSNNTDNYPLMQTWGGFGVHDVAVTSVTVDRTWVGQGISVSINVTILNKGDFEEKTFVALYYDLTANKTIGVQDATLFVGQNETVAFVWDTTDVACCHNYTVAATATILADNYVEDNTLDGGPVTVRILGDIDGNNVVNVLDMIILTTHFGLKHGDAGWNADVDLNRDGKTNILDVIIMAYHFSIAYP